MATKKDIDEEILLVTALRNLTRTYAQIAAIRMKKIRGRVLYNRQFFGAISDIFLQVLGTYKKEIENLATRRGLGKRGGKITFLSHNGRTTAVFISANTGLYGGIVPKTYEFFLKEVEEENVEVTIVGRLGRLIFMNSRPDNPYTFFEYPDYGEDKKKLSQIIAHLVQYEKIHVYYGEFKTVVKQQPARFEISSEAVLKEAGKKEPLKYIFEPSMEDILRFFETEIFTSMFEQAIRESQLAKFASRILSMDKAEENIKNELGKLDFQKLLITHKNQNKKQLNSLSSILYSARV